MINLLESVVDVRINLIWMTIKILLEKDREVKKRNNERNCQNSANYYKKSFHSYFLSHRAVKIK
jgi:hypothetical protein